MRPAARPKVKVELTPCFGIACTSSIQAASGFQSWIRRTSTLGSKRLFLLLPLRTTAAGMGCAPIRVGPSRRARAPVTPGSTPRMRTLLRLAELVLADQLVEAVALLQHCIEQRHLPITSDPLAMPPHLHRGVAQAAVMRRVALHKIDDALHAAGLAENVVGVQ